MSLPTLWKKLHLFEFGGYSHLSVSFNRTFSTNFAVFNLLKSTKFAEKVRLLYDPGKATAHKV